MAMQTIEELFEHELKDMYSAERMLLGALERLAETAFKNIDRLKSEKEIDLIANLEVNEYLGNISLQLNVKDFDISN